MIQLLVALSIAILIWLALSPEVRGDMTAGSFIVIIAAAATMAKPIRQLTQVNERVQRGVAAARDLFAVLDAAPEIDTGNNSAADVRGELEFRAVSFRYQQAEREVLSEVNSAYQGGADRCAGWTLGKR